MPGTAWLLVACGLLVAAFDLAAYARGERNRARLASAALYGLGPLVAAGAAWLVLGPEAPMTAQIAVTLVVVAPLGPVLYRLAFAPLANASVLVLLMVAVAVHFVLVGLGLIAFGAEGARTPPLFADNIISAA
jgi:branched-chain amino acid transport system permease protein